MSLFFESIRVINGRVMNLSYHQDRVDHCTRQFYQQATLSLAKYIDRAAIPATGLYKLRIQYNPAKLDFTEQQITRYQPRTIRSFALVEMNEIDYSHKSEDRSELERAFAQKEGKDEIIIVREGRLTDSFYGNVALFDGKRWYTPKSYLLPGTMRAKLLKQGIIHEKEILAVDISDYRKIRFFNALNPWSGCSEVVV